MPVRLRLRRLGRKDRPYYHIVAADSRSPRDGRFIEIIGHYDPLTNPATIDLDQDKALGWLKNGAQPTETVRAILSYKGVLLKLHLFRKGFSPEDIQNRFETWQKDKIAQIQAKKDRLAAEQAVRQSERLAQESKRRQSVEERIRTKNKPAETTESTTTVDA